MAGSTLNERNIIFSYLFKEKTIKNVILSLDWWVFLKENDVSKFDFLYTENLADLFKMYFNEKSITCALHYNKSESCVGKKIDIYSESIVSWLKYSLEFFGGLQNFVKNEFARKDLIRLMNHKTQLSTITIKKSPQEILAPTLEMFKNTTQTQFHIILPTYHRLFYIIEGDKFFKAWQENIRYLLSECENLPNVRIYGLDDLDYADNIANYKDVEHYNIDMNILQLHAIATQTHILNMQNIESYFAKMQEKINNFDIKPFLEKAKEIAI